MKGDFSRWNDLTRPNLNGVLHQQGRVLLDADWNAHTRILNNWQDHAARQIIGEGVAAVSAHNRNAFKVLQARRVGDDVELDVHPGPAWLDGMALHLPGDPGSPSTRQAAYLEPPVQDPAAIPDTIDAGVRDAVVLEVWREALNGFQLPNHLIEPALGGPDTTERVQTAMRFRLYRLGEGETCHDIAEQLRDDPSSLGRLTATLQPTVVIGGDCPVVEGGGYVGFEHHLYRVEIAASNSPDVFFKWSAFNGGLVGRGECDLTGSDKTIGLTANDQAIITSGLTSCYVEVVRFDTAQGYWRVVYGAEAVLNGDVLDIGAEHFTDGPPPSGTQFIRIWNEIRPISDFPAGSDTLLRDGIQLAFEASTGSNYRPDDYWTFKVRAGDIGNPETLIDHMPPEGIRYHRAVLAELLWNPTADITFDNDQIKDCREIFKPLTDRVACCTYTVGDGVQSFGDFNEIEEALRHLPAEGGEICVLPGVHRANAGIISRRDVRIHGCGFQSVVTPHAAQAGQPIFSISNAQGIQIDHLTLVASGGTAIQVFDIPERLEASRRITIRENKIVACDHGIDIRVNNTRGGANEILIAYNEIAMLDKEGGESAIFCLADDVLIERNKLVVVPGPEEEEEDDGTDDDPSDGVFDPCAEPELVFQPGFPIFIFLYVTFGYLANLTFLQRITYKARGGIQIGGGSERVRVNANEIVGGSGHGITLGHLPELQTPDNLREISATQGFLAAPTQETVGGLSQTWDHTLYELNIDENTIRNMGLSGIGVVLFFNLKDTGLYVRVEDLTIYRNDIQRCAQMIPPSIPASIADDVGFGGIALAEVEEAVIQENRIEDNGFNHIEPVVGCFIRFGEKIDISNNRILNNGPEQEVLEDDPRPGTRGGIVVKMSFKQIVDLIGSDELLAPDGIPAVKVHDNIVTQPRGHALFLMAFGPVSVVGNHFTTQGNDFQVNPFSLLAGAVFILNLGISKDLIGAVLRSAFKNMANVNPAAIDANAQTKARVNDNQAVIDIVERLLYLPSGNVMYANNQTTLDLRDRQINLALSSQLIASLDDVAYTSNQSEVTSFLDVVLTDALIFGVSVRTNDNRFQEGVTVTLYSLMSYGLLNAAVSNQSTHCLLVMGNPTYLVEGGNAVVYPINCANDKQAIQQELAVPAQQATLSTSRNIGSGVIRG